jgi:hypothetical protein
MLPNAAVNFIMSTGVRLVPGVPPIVPLIPEILLINATTNSSKVNDYIRLNRDSKNKNRKGYYDLIHDINFGPGNSKADRLKSLIFVKEKLVMTRAGKKEWFRDWFSSPFYHRLYFET